MERKFNKEFFLIIISYIFIIATNNFYNFEESLIYGGNDGKFYKLISEYAPSFGNNIEYIKGERFLLPYLIGVLSKLTFLDVYLLYQIVTIFFVIVIIFLYKKILEFLKLDYFSYYISLLLLIFNPYLIRYYIAVPTIIVDLGFIISLELICLGFLTKNKNYFYYGLILSVISRQNAFIILVIFFVVKFFFKKKSIFSTKDIIISIISFICIFSLNTFYATNSMGDTTEVGNLYITTLVGIFIIDYTLNDLFKYLLFPLIGFGPLIVYSILLFYRTRNIKIIMNEFLVFLFLTAVILIGIAFVGGPTTTGKNLIRLSNFAYIYLVVLINLIFSNYSKFEKSETKFLILFIIFFLWSLHPTFSKIEIWGYLKNFFN